MQHVVLQRDNANDYQDDIAERLWDSRTVPLYRKQVVLSRGADHTMLNDDRNEW